MSKRLWNSVLPQPEVPFLQHTETSRYVLSRLLHDVVYFVACPFQSHCRYAVGHKEFYGVPLCCSMLRTCFLLSRAK